MCLGFPTLRSPVCAISPLLAKASTYPWKFPSLQAVGKPGLTLLPPPTTTLSCSSLHSATHSPNQWPFLQPLKVNWGPSSSDSSTRFPCCLAAVYITTSLSCLLHRDRRRLRMFHEFLDSQSSSFCLAGFKNSLSVWPNSPQPAKSDQQSTWPVVPVT